VRPSAGFRIAASGLGLMPGLTGSVCTFSRVFGLAGAQAFNAALYGYLAAVPASPSGALPDVTRHEREQRRAAAAAARPDPPGLLEQAAADGKTVRADGSQVHLLSVLDVATGCVRAQREIGAKTNEIPELAPAIARQVLSCASSIGQPCDCSHFQGGLGEYVQAGRAGMLMWAAAMTWRLPGQSLESLARERVVNRTVDGDVLLRTTRSQTRRLPPVT
jgi:hypothetical protein